MKQYLTISEFAGLRNVNINSIRYYEKQKFLMPAWIRSADEIPLLFARTAGDAGYDSSLYQTRNPPERVERIY